MEVVMDQLQFSGGGIYEIKVRGHIDEAQRYWFEGMTISTSLDDDGAPVTTFSGTVVDQAALHGVLARIRDMNLKLISVNKIKKINHKRRNEMSTTNSTQSNEQYSLAKILGLWAAAALPMGILAFVVYPALVPDFKADPIGAAFIRFGLITVGLIWVFVLSMIIVYREEGDLRWGTIRQRLWLNTPQDPKTGEPRRKLWLWLIPLGLLFFATLMTPILEPLNRPWRSVFPYPDSANFDSILGAPEIVAQLVGNWSFFGLFFIMAVFNILGEEFFFRGVMLPKMEGVFGKWDWVVNGVLMGAYHWHQPWMIPGAALIVAPLLFALPSRRFRSTWFGIIIHALQYLILIPMILALVLGLM
jgi:membrane protease YdiL (CAAX protease family)